MRKLLWQDQWRQALDFSDLRVAQLRWLAIKRDFILFFPGHKKILRQFHLPQDFLLCV
jgi:hypothetical protein